MYVSALTCDARYARNATSEIRGRRNRARARRTTHSEQRHDDDSRRQMERGSRDGDDGQHETRPQKRRRRRKYSKNKTRRRQPNATTHAPDKVLSCVDCCCLFALSCGDCCRGMSCHVSRHVTIRRATHQMPETLSGSLRRIELSAESVIHVSSRTCEWRTRRAVCHSVSSMTTCTCVIICHR